MARNIISLTTMLAALLLASLQPGLAASVKPAWFMQRKNRWTEYQNHASPMKELLNVGERVGGKLDRDVDFLGEKFGELLADSSNMWPGEKWNQQTINAIKRVRKGLRTVNLTKVYDGKRRQDISRQDIEVATAMLDFIQKRVTQVRDANKIDFDIGYNAGGTTFVPGLDDLAKWKNKATMAIAALLCCQHADVSEPASPFNAFIRTAGTHPLKRYIEKYRDEIRDGTTACVWQASARDTCFRYINTKDPDTN